MRSASAKLFFDCKSPRSGFEPRWHCMLHTVRLRRFEIEILDWLKGGT